MSDKSLVVRTALFAVIAFTLLASTSTAQVRQTALYLDDGSGHISIFSGATGGGSFTFPVGGGMLYTSGNSTSITALGTISSGVWQGTVVVPQYGGTGLATYTPYALLAGGTTATGNLQQISGLGSSNQVLTSNGPSALPTWQNAAGGSGTVTSVAMTVPSFLSVTATPITTSGTFAVTLSGTALPIANGGTSKTTANAAFNALSPMATLGDIEYENATPAAAVLSGNTTTTKEFLTSTGASGAATAPVWATIAGSDVPVFIKSGSTHAVGAVPDPGSTAGTTRYLREDATWVAPGGSSALMITGSSTQTFGGNPVGFNYPLGLTSLSPFPSTASISNNNQMILDRSGTLKNLTVTIATADGSTSTYKFTVYDGQTSTGVTVSISGTNVTATDNTDTYPVSAGDLISIKYSGTGSPPAVNAVWVFDIQ